ncbi:MAG: SDR family oxidoreductase [Bacteroidia bacterium]|nr:SDR family oxidoreductase [Bacteroidia bacterium]MCF8446454.1 SDR family oxidoreductase [Bacteroidia bacterium]
MEKFTKCALITGGTSQLGFELVKCFAQNNWRVHATTRNLKKLTEKHQIPNVTFHQLDLTLEKEISEFINKLSSLEPQIDLLLNNAGFVLSGPFEACSDEQIRRQMDVNFFGTLFTIKALLPKFKSQKNGTIINISSLCGLTTFPMLSVYHASKWALEGFTESLMYELAPFGIRVKLIEPGGIMDNNYQSKIEFAEKDLIEYKQLLDKVHHSNWFPSFTSPEEIANKLVKIAEENSLQLRHRIGEDCELLLNERMENQADEQFLLNTKNRILGN